MTGLGKKGPPFTSICGPSPPLPLGCLTLKANSLAHPEAPGDATPPDPCTFIKERGFWFGKENTNSLSLSLSSLALLAFHVFHSCALTEVVHRSGFTSAVTSENSVAGRPGSEPLHSSADRAGQAPGVGMLCLQSGALYVQLLTLKWSPATGYAKHTQHHVTEP
ncbi:unnamed protein product [Pleuronectes platessa]|uniref:Uncharacterized protein n=1 Tax=Pleuronectes platessa TaxID=8262 RepID=A0A9N7VHI4_PLEPL|nr:unnamed protein product [Pleuronectes platessa]